MTEDTALRILIVDDHVVVCGGLEAMLSCLGRVAIATDGAEALRLCAAFDPHVVLLDLKMPGLHGYDTLSVITREWPRIRVLILTGEEHPSEATLARQRGAAGFLRKIDSPATLLHAVQTVAAGGEHFPKTSEPAGIASEEGPTAREVEALWNLARGLSNDEIGQGLGIAAETVKVHLRNLFPKLQAANRTEVVTRAHEWRLL
jgi:DNA-binding NarL/FixJ family response regulator